MIRTTVSEFLRRALSHSLDWLDRWEQRSPRAQKQPWYLTPVNLPPAVTAFVSTIFLFVALYYGTHPTWLQAMALGLLVLISMGLLIFYIQRDLPQLAKNGEAMALLSVVFFTTVLFIKFVAANLDKSRFLSPFITPIGIAPLLTALLIHPRLAMVMTFVVSLIFGMVNHFSLPFTLVATVGGLTLVAASTKARTAQQVWKAGILSGFAQMGIIFFFGVSFHWDREITLIALISSFVSALTATILSLGLRPFLEGFFSRTSNLRLLELSDVNHPLLKRMSLEAPGTFHHSMIVASLAEDAANAVGANGLLCRVGAYFHDIGKMVKAEYFIENQGAFGNPHDQVSPSLSKLVITSHVKEGMALAKSYKLDQQVADIIPQHHGTSKIEYFYHKALKIEEQDDDKEGVDAETYRYPGPKPQSREAGIVMMADSVEAASRTLEEPTHQRYKDMVYKIVNKKLFDNQLDETSLTLRDLHTIAERFTATLSSLHHSRIPYPETEKTSEPREFTPPA